MKCRIVPRPVLHDDLPEGLPEILRRVFARRDRDAVQAWQQGTGALSPASRLLGIDQVVERLARALADDERILVVGDYDADGATSTALAVRALRAMGGQVDCLVPDRFRFGYGLGPAIVDVAHEQHRPDVIMTVDNGISSHSGIDRANALGIDVIVTDHHLSGETLPAACAIVNPNQPGDDFPSRHIAGVGVCWYVMAALRSELRRQGWFERRGLREPNIAALLDLVALGTVADCVRLDRINRILIAQGLARIRHGACVPGISALCEVAGRQQTTLTASDLGFALGPRLNAAGRLEDMGIGIECLLTDDPARARMIAGELDLLNRQRREIEDEMRSQAEALLDEMDWNQGNQAGLALFHEDWHQGVIGILASRIKERLHRPVIAFALAGDDQPDMLKGSARSIRGLHIRDVLATIDGQTPGLIARFGGHAMAAGLSLARNDLGIFQDHFATEVARVLGDPPQEGIIESDGSLDPANLTLEAAKTLDQGGPWGQGFPEPLFDGPFIVRGCRIVGQRHLKLRVRHPNGGPDIDAIAFNTREDDCPPIGQPAHLAYRLDINRYRGIESVQLIIEQIDGTASSHDELLDSEDKKTGPKAP